MSRNRKTWVLLAAAVSAYPALPSSTARATITFNLEGLSSLPANAQAGFQKAANYWSNSLDVIQNHAAVNVTINIAVGFSSLGSNILGETDSQYYGVDPNTGNYTPATFSQVRSGLSLTSSSADDAAAVASLPSGASFSVYINHTSNNSNSATPYTATGINRVQLTRANAKALGLIVGSDPSLDATITFSSDFNFDFDKSNGTDSNALDFVGVATHEIGHALGFDSAVDNIDGNATGTALAQNNVNYAPFALDLFRYSTNSTTNGTIDLTADTRTKYFSLNKGVTTIANESTGVNVGDGNQASHWQQSTPPLGIMIPAYAFGQTINLSMLDRQAFDVIGWAKINTWNWADTSSSSTAFWGNAPQWSADGVPDSTIAAVFNNGSSTAYTIAINTQSTAGAVTIANDAVTFNLTNSTLTSTTLALGQTAGNVATLNVQKVSAGQYNTGNITVGAVVLTTGHLNIQSGGILSSTGALAVAPVATSVGTVTIGAGTLSTTGDTSIGGTSAAAGGTGSLAVNSGGTLNVGGNFRIWGTAGTGATLAGGTLSVTGGTTISSGALMSATSGTFNSSTLTLSGTLNQSGGTIGVTNAATIASGGIFTQTNGAFTSNGLTLNGSLVENGGSATAGAITGTGSATASAGTLNANSITIASLTASGTGRVLLKANGGNTGTSRVSSLSITGNGKIDLNDNDLILDYSGASPLTTLRGYLVTGFNSGNWNGPGLDSLMANTNATVNTALGYAEASTLGLSTFDGQSVDSTTLLVKYTYYGDANLDGKVDATDFSRFIDGLATGGSLWSQGDFTFDGHVDLGNDFNLFETNYLRQGGALGDLAAVVEASPALSVVQRATLLAIVPEPSTMVLGMAVGSAILSRRRRRIR